jgi:O-antigen ligase
MIGTLLVGGLWATLSRGPWLTALLVTVLYLALNPKGMASAIKAITAISVIIVLILLSPFGDQVVAYVPFLGGVDAQNVEYRQRLFETSIVLIKQNPFFGNPRVLDSMQSLKQGQGIIDLVNGYLQIALFYGLVGVVLFVALLSLAVKKGITAWWYSRFANVEAAFVFAVLVAAMVSTMFFIATASYGGTTYMIAGMLASCWYVAFHSSKRRPTMAAALSPGIR